MVEREQRRTRRGIVARGGSIEEMLADLNAKIAWIGSRNMDNSIFLSVEKIEGTWVWPFVVSCEEAFEEMTLQLREIEPDCFDDGSAPVSCLVLFEYQKEFVRDLLEREIKNEGDQIRKEKLRRILERFEPTAEAEI